MPAIARRTHVDWELIYEEHGAQLSRYEELLESFEHEYSLDLSPGAIEILFVPIIESIQNEESLDYAEVAETLRKVVSQLAHDPDSRDQGKQRRSSWSVLKAIWARWCDIPPFCSETKG